LKVEFSGSGGPVKGVIPTHLLGPGNRIGRKPSEHVVAMTVFQIFGQENNFVGGFRAVDCGIGDSETRAPKRSIDGQDENFVG